MLWSTIAVACISAWAVDSHEPDDTFAQAQAQAPTYHIAGQGPIVLPPLEAEPGGQDWFHAYVDCCRAAGARVQWRRGQPAPVMRIFDDQGIPLSATDPRVEIVTTRRTMRVRLNNYSGDFYVRISNPLATTIDYRLSLLAPVWL